MSQLLQHTMQYNSFCKSALLLLIVIIKLVFDVIYNLMIKQIFFEKLNINSQLTNILNWSNNNLTGYPLFKN